MKEVLAVFKETEDVGITIRQSWLKPLGDLDALVKPYACGICGSDLKTYEFQSYRREFLRQSMPVIMGHEVAGQVIQVGRLVKHLRPGDRVLTDPVMHCGNCRLCNQGRTNICESRKILGYETDGGMAQMAVLPASCLITIPSEIEYIDAPLLEILATAVHAIERVGLVSGQPCAILGPGPLGIMLLQALKASGAWPITVFGSERSRPRLELAMQLGADEVIVVNEDNIGQHLSRYEYVFEVAGKPEALTNGARITRRGGKLIFASGFDQVSADFRLNEYLKNREIDLVTSTGHPRTAWDIAISLVLSGKVRLSGLVDSLVPLAQADKAFHAAFNRENFKTVIICNPSDSKSTF